MDKLFDGYTTEVVQTQHSELYPRFGVIISPKDESQKNHLREILGQENGPSRLDEILDEVAWLVLKNIPPQDFRVSTTSFNPAENSVPIFWHSDFIRTGRKYNLLYNGGVARTVATTGFSDRAVIRPRLLQFLESSPAAMEKVQTEFATVEAEIKSSRLRPPEKNNHVAWGDFILERVWPGHPITTEFGDFLGDEIARYCLGANELMCFANAETPDGPGPLHCRIVVAGANEKVKTWSDSFSSFDYFKQQYDFARELRGR
ncbi:MAG: hypothetical protein AAB558_03235 [Patescibacteria group bacterium]